MEEYLVGGETYIIVHIYELISYNWTLKDCTEFELSQEKEQGNKGLVQELHSSAK